MKLASNGEVERQTFTESVDTSDTTVHKTVAVGVGTAEESGQLAWKQAASLLPVEVQHAGYSVN